MPLSKSLEENFMQVPQFWGKDRRRRHTKTAAAHMGGEPMGVLGVSACPENDDWEYYVAVASEAPGAGRLAAVADSRLHLGGVCRPRPYAQCHTGAAKTDYY